MKYYVGAKISPDGELDLSKALVYETIDFLYFTEKELDKLLMQIKSSTEFKKKLLIKQFSKKHNISYEKALFEIRKYAKYKMLKQEKGDIKHYHRTSLDNFKKILQTGSLLSRTKLKEKKPNIDIPSWSASDAVMFTKDSYDKNGKLISQGFDKNNSVGAISSDVVFVFNSKMIHKNDYDCTGYYPTIEELPLQNYCEKILIKKEHFNEIQNLLKNKGLNIVLEIL